MERTKSLQKPYDGKQHVLEIKNENVIATAMQMNMKKMNVTQCGALMFLACSIVMVNSMNAIGYFYSLYKWTKKNGICQNLSKVTEFCQLVNRKAMGSASC